MPGCDGLFAGNPILPASAEKYRSETDWADAGPSPLSLERTYRSNWARYITRPDTGLGAVWTHNHGVRLSATPALAPTEVAIAMPDGSRRTFARPPGAAAWIAEDHAGSLTQGPGDTWTYRRADDDTHWTFDSAGKLQAKAQRNGWAVNYDYNAAGQLATIRNGFGRSLALAYNASGQLTSVTTPDARVIGYAHDDQGRLSSVSYPDGKGNLLSQAITDTASSPNTTRTWQWTWNAQGLAATETEPNGAVTRFEYDALGNLVKSTNALGHVTQHGFDSANRLIGTNDAAGLSTTYTWDARDRLLSKTVTGQGTTTLRYTATGLIDTLTGQGTTTLSYTATGLLDTLTLPSGLVVSYSYDAAHRLTGWSNNRGESGSYTLDAMGNRVVEQVRDSTAALAWTAARTINNLNRVSARTEGANQTNSFGYDLNGELVTETDGLNQSTQYGLDPLRRVKAITNAANATAALSYNALVTFRRNGATCFRHIGAGCNEVEGHHRRSQA